MTSNGDVLDVVTIGRVSVDLYGQQIGGRLEDMGSFAKSVGGSPANMAIGAARLGLRAGFVSRVGDEAMGRFIREQMQREGVDTRYLRIDLQRLTALVLLGVRDETSFPLIFYRENCADNALDESDIDEAYIASARAIVVTGTHFALANTDAAQRKAMEIARARGRKVVFDIDYRPNLWGLAGHGAGESRFIASDRVSEHLQSLLPMCDLIVGTEEEIRIAGGADSVSGSLRAIRKLTDATIVLKRGPMGCVVFEGSIPDDLSRGVVGEGFPVEVYNVLGAGDAFMAGFLSGWLRQLPLSECARRANACGAIAVSRLLCSPEYPTAAELAHFLEAGSSCKALRHDATLSRIHRATTRRPINTPLAVVDIDGLASTAAVPHRTAQLLLEALTIADMSPAGRAVILGDATGLATLYEAAGRGVTVFRPCSPSLKATDLIEWPVEHVVLACAGAGEFGWWGGVEAAAARLGHEFALRVAGTTEMMSAYAAGARPDWWLLDGAESTEPSLAEIARIEDMDPLCRGTVILGPNGGRASCGGGVDAARIAAVLTRWSEHSLDDKAFVNGVATEISLLAAQLIAARSGPKA